MILHTLNRPPGHPALANCLRLSAPGCGILLLEDGVYAALDTETNRDLLHDSLQDKRFYVLETDLQARGISTGLIKDIRIIGYPEFVQLTLEYSKVQNWY